MTAEELLKPRFKVIADYPHSPYKIGDVIDFGDGYSTKKMTETPYDDPWGEINYASNHYDEDEFRKYPALFQPLAWWEERKSADLPQYIKYCNEDQTRLLVCKVVEWDLDYGQLPCAWADDRRTEILAMTNECYPATEAEYLTYKNKNNE